MPYRANYPRTVAELLDDTMTFRPAALRALRAFRRQKPWQGTLAQRRAKFRRLNRALAAAYGLPVPRLILPSSETDRVANGCYSPSAGGGTIQLVGKLSVVTYLHEFGHARGYDERQAVRWSANLFRRVFPRSFARLRHDGHMLVRP